MKHRPIDLCTQLTGGAGAYLTHIPPHESQEQLAQRLKVPNELHTISEATYNAITTTIPTIIRIENISFHAKGTEPLQMVWRVGFRHLFRQLTQQESDEVYSTANVSQQ